MKTLHLVLVVLLLAGCPANMPRAPQGTLEGIEAAELTAQQLSASITNLTCTKFVAKKCAEPGKAFDPDQGKQYHDIVQKYRAALKTASTTPFGQTADCLGVKRSADSCLAVVRAGLAQLETITMQRSQ